jgi:rRNA-processing protein FCF1
MSEVIICDTNVAIHLAIICPGVLLKPPDNCKIVIHSIVKTELHKLSKDPEKVQRLGDIFNFLLQNVNSYSQLIMPDNEKRRKDHSRLIKFEEGLPSTNTAPSSHYDRELLILAKKNSKKLLTNDKKLHQLSSAFIGADKTWRTGDALSTLLGIQALNKIDVQNGLNKLKPYNEYLCTECATLLKNLGLTI